MLDATAGQGKMLSSAAIAGLQIKRGGIECFRQQGEMAQPEIRPLPSNPAS